MSASSRLPLLRPEPQAVLAWRGREPVQVGEFLAQVEAVAAALPAQRYAVNLCRDRYAFLVAFAACLVRGQVNLLPPTHAPLVVEQILTRFPESYRLSDTEGEPGAHCIRWPGSGGHGHTGVPSIEADRDAAILFTSGTTGWPHPYPKRWGDLVRAHALWARRILARAGEGAPSLVVTVPPQHMYGLETSVLPPLLSGASVYCGASFYPADIHDALLAVPPPRILVTTPIHLRTCLAAGLTWPALAFVLSATAPLAPALAAQTEAVMACPLLEIYGCTEAGSLASRRTLDGDRWHLYDETGLQPCGEGYGVRGGHLPGPTPLHDDIEPLDARGFRLFGRHSDLINVAGKRASLADLNLKLCEIEGVLDGVFIVPDANEARAVGRLAALVVAPAVDEAILRRELARRIDPVFMPRPLCRVDGLPRSPTGKLPRAALLELLAKRGNAP
jgi:acyl-coenzyme A synthetase/AMP-(fatty) acid ligase